MGKVMFTKAQENVFKKVTNSELTADEYIEDHANGTGFIGLHDVGISVSMLARALHRGYEVEPKFKVGDWVHSEKFGVTGKIRDISRAKLYIFNEEYDSIPMPYARHATPEEIFWAENDRNVWELREKDLIKINDCIESISSIGDGTYVFESDNYATEKDMELLIKKGNVKVACFAEDRKDVDING